MKCHNCGIKISRFELRKHICKNQFRSVGISNERRAYLKRFGSRSDKKIAVVKSRNLPFMDY